MWKQIDREWAQHENRPVGSVWEERANAVGQPAPGNVTFCETATNAMDTGCLESQNARSKRTAIAPSFGIGFNAFFKEFVGINLHWRGIPFK